MFLPSFVSSPEILNPYTTSQVYQYQPIHYNSINILTQPLISSNPNNDIIDNNKARAISIKRNANTFCGYCLPTNTPIPFEVSHQPLQQQELLITGSKRVGFKSLFVNREKEIPLSDSFEQYLTLEKHDSDTFKNLRFNHKGNITKTIMVSKSILITPFINRVIKISPNLKYKILRKCFSVENRQSWCAGVFT